MKRPILALLTLLAACGTPQEQCINRQTRDLGDQLVHHAQVEGNLKRGYALEEYTVSFPVFEPCLRPGTPTAENPAPAPVASTCRDTVTSAGASAPKNGLSRGNAASVFGFSHDSEPPSTVKSWEKT